MRQGNRLTALKVARLTARGRHADGNGLYLQISEWNTKAWIFRYERGGRQRHMGLGPVALVSLAEAREKALGARKALLAGI
jgi:Arm DNA-binding domain